MWQRGRFFLWHGLTDRSMHLNGVPSACFIAKLQRKRPCNGNDPENFYVKGPRKLALCTDTCLPRYDRDSCVAYTPFHSNNNNNVYVNDWIYS